MLIITDQQRQAQQRQAQHWPNGWIQKHMPTMARLQRHGLTFTNNYTAATACSPSRASFLTGVYPSVHGLQCTPPNPPDCALNPGGDVWIAGGWPNNDARYVSGVPDTFNRMTPAVGGGESILQYLDNYDPQEDKPFLLVCSFGNPHDISVWPDQEKWGYDKADYAKLKEINLPSNYKAVPNEFQWPAKAGTESVMCKKI